MSDTPPFENRAAGVWYENESDRPTHPNNVIRIYVGANKGERLPESKCGGSGEVNPKDARGAQKNE